MVCAARAGATGNRPVLCCWRGQLATLGGSWYFLVAGIVIVLSAIQFLRAKSSAVVLFLLAFVGTLVWAVVDAGLVFWPLVSRLMVPAGLMILAFLTWPALRKRENKPSLAKLSYALSAVIAVGMVATLVQMFQPHPTVAATGPELPLIPVEKSKQQQNWDNYGNTAGGSRFVALDQITRDNVKDLQVAWTYRTGTFPKAQPVTVRKIRKRRCRSVIHFTCARRTIMSLPSKLTVESRSGSVKSTHRLKSGLAAVVWPISTRRNR